ncbi:MAG: hypothetical protein GC137_00740 [Alphaproteobacteria bacterium]|nr:hypothetical protein [Alphaproteobacteria bacterium]
MYKAIAVVVIEIIIGIMAYMEDKQIALAITIVLIPLTVIIPYYIGRWGLESPRKKRRRKKTFDDINSPEFKKWETQVLQHIYRDADMVKLFGNTYTAAIIEPAKRIEYPFNALCHLDSTTVKSIKLNRDQKKYLKLLGSTFRHNMTGFAMTKLETNDDGKVEKIRAKASDYKSNLVTAHILQWELYNLYKREKGSTDFKNILEKLPLRKQYHGQGSALHGLLDPSDKAHPLISVQAIVIFRDTRSGNDDGWKVVVAQRSENVTIAPNLWQFQPAGGFEVFGREGDHNEILIKQGFDIRTALLREYAEELFRVEEFQQRTDSRDATSILSEENVARLIKMIKKGSAHMEFIGAVVELSFLRHEMSFLIIIDDEEFCKHGFKGSEEAKEIVCMSPKDVREYLVGGNLHSSSAGALALALKHPLLAEKGILEEFG